MRGPAGGRWTNGQKEAEEDMILTLMGKQSTGLLRFLLQINVHLSSPPPSTTPGGSGNALINLIEKNSNEPLSQSTHQTLHSQLSHFHKPSPPFQKKVLMWRPLVAIC